MLNKSDNNEENSHVLSGGSGDIAVIGEGTPNSTSISIQVLQGIYHELTGKIERVSKSYNQPFKVINTDLEQLHYRIQQAVEQYNVKAETHEFNIFYQNDTQDRFSSFERFKSFNAGSSSAVESVLFKYNFMVILPKTQQPQGYTLSIRIASPISIQEKMRNEMFQLPKIIRLMGNRTAVVTVEYVDYMVSRNLLDNVDLWFQTLSTAKSSPAFDFIRKRSAYIPIMSRYIIGAFGVFLVFEAIPILLNADTRLHQFAYFSLSAFTGLFATYKLAGHLGSLAEDAIDRWNPIAYVKLTAGDKKQIEKAECSNKRTIYFAIASLLTNLAIGIASSIFASWLTSTHI